MEPGYLELVPLVMTFLVGVFIGGFLRRPLEVLLSVLAVGFLVFWYLEAETARAYAVLFGHRVLAWVEGAALYLAQGVQLLLGLLADLAHGDSRSQVDQLILSWLEGIPREYVFGLGVLIGARGA